MGGGDIRGFSGVLVQVEKLHLERGACLSGLARGKSAGVEVNPFPEPLEDGGFAPLFIQVPVETSVKR
ncbi:MAG: hypothetical protein RLZZ399_2266 [Verrucomicrobiota bacterium]|jgi:hypothetical protein